MSIVNIMNLSPTKIGINQHDILHQMYPGDCCLCRTEARNRELYALLMHQHLPQRQDDTNAQLRDVLDMANRMGCYDAADIISKLVKDDRPRLVDVIESDPVDAPVKEAISVSPKGYPGHTGCTGNVGVTGHSGYCRPPRA